MSSKSILADLNAINPVASCQGSQLVIDSEPANKVFISPIREGRVPRFMAVPGATDVSTSAGEQLAGSRGVGGTWGGRKPLCQRDVVKQWGAASSPLEPGLVGVRSSPPQSAGKGPCPT